MSYVYPCLTVKLFVEYHLCLFFLNHPFCPQDISWKISSLRNANRKYPPVLSAANIYTVGEGRPLRQLEQSTNTNKEVMQMEPQNNSIHLMFKVSFKAVFRIQGYISFYFSYVCQLLGIFCLFGLFFFCLFSLLPDFLPSLSFYIIRVNSEHSKLQERCQSVECNSLNTFCLSLHYDLIQMLADADNFYVCRTE